MRAGSAPRGSQTRSMSSACTECGVWANLWIVVIPTRWWPIRKFDRVSLLELCVMAWRSPCSITGVTGCLRYPIPVVSVLSPRACPLGFFEPVGDCSASLRGMGWSPVRSDGVPVCGGPKHKVLPQRDAMSLGKLSAAVPGSFPGESASSSRSRRLLLTAPFTIPLGSLLLVRDVPTCGHRVASCDPFVAKYGFFVGFIWAQCGYCFRAGSQMVTYWPRSGPALGSLWAQVDHDCSGWATVASF